MDESVAILILMISVAVGIVIFGLLVYIVYSEFNKARQQVTLVTKGEQYDRRA